jgi:hypothetical protein
MKIVLMAATLLSAAFLAAPARCAVFDLSSIEQSPTEVAAAWYLAAFLGNPAGAGFVTNALPSPAAAVSVLITSFDQPPAVANATPILVAPPNTITDYARLATAIRNSPYGWVIYGNPGVPITTINVPVTITDTSTGESSMFHAIVSTVGLAATIAAFYDVPLTAEAGVLLDVFSFVVETYGPATHVVYAGVNDFVTGVINAGVGAMNAGVVPIGPDPLFDFAFTIEATRFQGSFDAIGDINDISGIHNISLFVDGIPAVGANAVSEPSTWAMLIIGLVGLAYKTTKWALINA